MSDMKIKSALFLSFLVFTTSATFARTQDIAAWRGETVTVRLEDFVRLGGEVPSGVKMRTGVICDVTYRESPEALRWQLTSFDYYKGPEIDRTLKAHHRYTVADRVSFGPDEKGVRIVEFAVSPEAKAGTYAIGDVSLRIVDRVLPPVKEQKGFLDLWQHPWAVSRYFGVKPFSKEHYAKMAPLWKLLADCGGRALTVTLVDEPWNHQCFDAYHSMIGRKKVKGKGEGEEWKFDYSLFDEYVEFGRRCGIGPYIACYTMCPWNYFVSWEDEDGRLQKREAKPGTAFFEEYWGPFLTDFAKHLKEKGWFDNTFISMDERSREDVMNIWKLLREKAPGLKISMAGDKPPSEMDGIEIACYSQGLSHVKPEFVEVAKRRREKGFITTIYTCCWPPRPNTFLSSGAGEAFWLGFYPGAVGFDGYLRWAFNSWGADPMHDGSYDRWLAGDVALAYPDGSPSWRLLELRRGMVAAEKYRLLKASGQVPEKLANLVKSLDAEKAMRGDVLFQCIEEAAVSAVNE